MSTPSAALPPQLTFRAITLAIVLAMILAAANTYLGLFAGMTIASAIPAAVVSMAVLRALGGGGILENNIVQTGASAGSSIASGVRSGLAAARASAAPWLPEECVATTRVRRPATASSSKANNAWVAPRYLNAPACCRFSHLR